MSEEKQRPITYRGIENTWGNTYMWGYKTGDSTKERWIDKIKRLFRRLFRRQKK
ncbi:MAG: hypothetical protein H8D26_04645 [Methanomicrobia archaeon]|nr:hypothetical protein [Methanomicrobia archaeon]